MPNDPLPAYLAHVVECYSEQWLRQEGGLGHAIHYVTLAAGEAHQPRRVQLLALAHELSTARGNIAYLRHELGKVAQALSEVKP